MNDKIDVIFLFVTLQLRLAAGGHMCVFLCFLTIQGTFVMQCGDFPDVWIVSCVSIVEVATTFFQCFCSVYLPWQMQAHECPVAMHIYIYIYSIHVYLYIYTYIYNLYMSTCIHTCDILLLPHACLAMQTTSTSRDLAFQPYANHTTRIIRCEPNASYQISPI